MSEPEHRRGGFRISEWAIRHPIPVSLVFIAAVLGGILCYNALPIKNYPNISFPAVLVEVTRSGAAPAEMEAQITRPIENSLAGLNNVESISSSITQGTSVTFVQFELGQDLNKVTEDVRSKVDQTRNAMPRDIDPPIVQRLEIDNDAIITYTLSAPGLSETELSWFIDDTVARDLQAQDGVSQITRLGGLDREINVLIDPDRLAAQGLTASQVQDALTQADVDIPGGRVTIGGREQILRVLGAATTVDRIRNLTIPSGAGRFVRLSDVADVGDGAAEPRGFASLDGKPVVGFEVSKTKLASEVSTENNVDKEVARLQKLHPEVTFRKVNSRVDQTRAGFSATLHTLLEGMALASLVVWLFLRDWRATAITAVAMPVSLLPTFIFMQLAGFSLNMVTLLGLTLVIGILVDDAIVEIENIEKRVFVGARPFDAAVEGADQIGLAVVACTFSIVAVFFPVAFMPGISGQFFKEFGLTVSVAVLFSLVVARMLTPLLAAYLLVPKTARPRRSLPRFYTAPLNWALDHRWAAISIGGVLFIGSLALFIPLKKGVQPESNFNFLQINVQGPPGATLADMHRTMGQVSALLSKEPEVQDLFVEVGAGGISQGNGGLSNTTGINNGSVLVLLKPNHPKVAKLRDRMRAELRDIPDARVLFDISGFGSGSVSELLVSENGAGLDETASELQREMRTVKGIADPRNTTPPSAPELVVRPKVDEAARLGVSVTAIANAARIATLGDIDANVSKLDEGERRIPVRVRFPESARSNLDVLRNMRLPTAGGGTTTLDSVATIGFQAGPGEIDRFGRERMDVIAADTTGDTQIGDAIAKVNKLPIFQHLPPGVHKASQGQEKAYAQLFGGFAVAIMSAIGLVYGVMVLLFQSFFKPVIILSALPTAIGGALLALLMADSMLSIPSLIGFLMLMGLAAKNSILLVEYAIEREREGASQREALLEACRERARPIVMTTMAMAAGMLPTALTLGKGSEFRQPMAIAVIGGLITSTVLSLLLVPVVYEIVDDLEIWLKPRLGRLVTPREAPGKPKPKPAPTPTRAAAE
ncbi:MAG TPA: efflux RND transporter permease subunit [Caulobacteraceae bacterium]|jgi:HAE1 family hydrophobic/amphiphilic exporter-1|nr:efflux RND transporter permease subunit [Caulobacteraceae bacterium]